MSATLTHFAINADDVERSRAFYERVFGWKFEPWGPPGFYNCQPAGSPVRCALQQRRALVPGQRTLGFECTISVDSIDDTEAAVLAAGGTVLMPRAVIPGVGTLMFFGDPDGNLFGAMQHERAGG
jgi:predicted enzyme related to lactoylglutathione lyase